jgi:hypothetical protein
MDFVRLLKNPIWLLICKVYLTHSLTCQHATFFILFPTWQPVPHVPCDPSHAACIIEQLWKVRRVPGSTRSDCSPHMGMVVEMVMGHECMHACMPACPSGREEPNPTRCWHVGLMDSGPTCSEQKTYCSEQLTKRSNKRWQNTHDLTGWQNGKVSTLRTTIWWGFRRISWIF